MKKDFIRQVAYSGIAFDANITRLVDQARSVLGNINYDTMIGTGLSGALVVPILARMFGKRFAIVRKNDGSHSHYMVEGEIGRRWIFVDDFVATGASRARVRRLVGSAASEWDHKTEYVGTYEYSGGWGGRFRRAGEGNENHDKEI